MPEFPEQKNERLFAATKSLLKAKTPKEEILSSLNDLGLPRDKAIELLEQAQKEVEQDYLFEKPKEEFNPNKQQASSPMQKNTPLQKNTGFFSKMFPTKTQQLKEEVLKAPSRPLKDLVKANQKDDSEFKITFDNTEPEKKPFREIMPMRVSDFDKLISAGGLKRGDTILISGGCGTGKTTFGIQSLYHGALKGEKGVYLSLEETPQKMKENMMQNYGWDIESLEREGKIAILKIDPLTIARAVEAALTKERGGLYIEFEQFDLPMQFDLPFKPDRVVVDSLSALSIAFMENEQGYRQYLRHLFETLEKYNSVNLVFGETEQDPGIYSRSGIEEFLADGVIVFYNMKIHNIRQRAIEILKLRSSAHIRKITPYTIGQKGIEIFINQELFLED